MTARLAMLDRACVGQRGARCAQIHVKGGTSDVATYDCGRRNGVDGVGRFRISAGAEG